MSANRNLAQLPLAGLSRMFNKLAAGLRGETSDVLLLTGDQVCRQTLAMLRSTSPFLEKSLKTCLPFLLLIIGLSRYFSKFLELRGLKDQVCSSLLSHVTVPGLSPLNKEVCAYMAKRGIGQDSRSLTIAEKAPKSSNTSMAFLPAVSSASWFRFNGRSLRFSRTRNDDETPETYVPAKRNGHGGLRVTGGGKADPDITVSCFSITGSVKPIKAFLEHVLAAAEAEKAAMISITRWAGDTRPGARGEFDPIEVHRPARKLDSVSMEVAKRTAMIEDMTVYLASRKWYGDRGIPWRRGYLLYGPPGTGKTSTATALSGHFRIPLIIISLSSPGMTDASLQMMFDELPEKCIVLLEDIDSAGIKRERSSEPDYDDQEEKPAYPKFRPLPTPKANVTLSGLLNAIDGPCSHEGRILLCTTNSPTALDAALIRPGRIDMKILFGYASAEVSESLHLHIFQDPEGKRDHDLAALARAFAAAVPEDQLSPAEIQNYLLSHREDPAEAVKGAAEWAERLLETKSQGGNVASFNGEI